MNKIPNDKPSLWERFFGKTIYETRSGKNIKRGPVVLFVLFCVLPLLIWWLSQ